MNGKKYRRLSEKHLRLVLFSLDRSPEEPLAQQMQGWNEAHPEWRYEHVTNFGRDRTQAQRRVLHPDFPMW